MHDQLEDTRDEFNKITQEGCDYDKESVNIDLEGDSEVWIIMVTSHIFN